MKTIKFIDKEVPVTRESVEELMAYCLTPKGIKNWWDTVIPRRGMTPNEIWIIDPEEVFTVVESFLMPGAT